MSDQKDNNIGQWYNPLITNVDRENISEELSDKEIEEYDKLWKASRNFSPSSGLKSADRWERFEEMNDEVTIIPVYRSSSFRKAIGAFIAASVLFALLYILIHSYYLTSNKMSVNSYIASDMSDSLFCTLVLYEAPKVLLNLFK